jgi:hypothetical protein
MTRNSTVHAFLLLTSLLAGCAARAGSGDGRVIDFVTNEPIPNATVELTCSKVRQWHGSISTTFTVESRSPDGSFHFDPGQPGLGRCDVFFARAVKAGYSLDNMTAALTSPNAAIAATMPKIVYLVKDSDLPMVQLRHVAGWIPAKAPTAGPNAAAEFGWLYSKFVESKRLAVTPELAAWVSDRYCKPLRSAYAMVSEPQRSRLDTNYFAASGTPIAVRPDSYAAEVVPYCGGSL